MARKLKKKRIFITSVLLLTIGLSFVFFLTRSQTSSETLKRFPAKTLVHHEIKVDVLPLSLTPPIKFYISVESFEESDLAHINLLETVLLLDNDQNVSKPIRWEEKENSTYKQSGYLYFPNLQALNQQFELVLFALAEFNFKWKLTQ